MSAGISVIIDACRKILDLNESHSLAEFGCFSESKALAALVLSALDPPPSRVAVLTVREIDNCAQRIARKGQA